MSAYRELLCQECNVYIASYDPMPMCASCVRNIDDENERLIKERDAARAECEKLRKALDESLLFLDSAAQASPLIPSTLVRIMESVRGTLRNALAKETP